MVVFTCDRCNESLKKPKVQYHGCRQTTFTCVDCFVTFTWENFNVHNKCITEQQRYGGANFVAKDNKGEQKQMKWAEQVGAAAEFATGMTKKRLEKMSGQDNVPRKRKPFINFAQNNFGIKEFEAEKLWDELQEALAKLEDKNKVAEEEISKVEETDIGKVNHESGQTEVTATKETKKEKKRKQREAEEAYVQDETVPEVTAIKKKKKKQKEDEEGN
ncbi:unnamed protein product [Bursaphelenchus okinawaensis]|uniref:Zinc finger C2H2 LYAR-type domain-containing protein n=1 Tax=Bursaphelenchus okinawaensis TaxID=465554 RepID=A0A811KNM5_9BILA|nr:unnamed protein product [Bursaphelenchus okinawaensis]CAG9106841.1 unnamed protein product [Bursaphelenchus okinawaensis]